MGGKATECIEASLSAFEGFSTDKLMQHGNHYIEFFAKELVPEGVAAVTCGVDAEVMMAVSMITYRFVGLKIV